jgi:hypothetical protein
MVGGRLRQLSGVGKVCAWESGHSTPQLHPPLALPPSSTPPPAPPPPHTHNLLHAGHQYLGRQPHRQGVRAGQAPGTSGSAADGRRGREGVPRPGPLQVTGGRPHALALVRWQRCTHALIF